MKHVKNTIVLLAIGCFCLISGVAAAQNKSGKAKSSSGKAAGKTTPETETGQETNSPSASAGEAGILKNHGEEIRKIMKTDSGVVRGYNFGTTKQKIRDTEDAQYVADGKDFMIYNVQINDKEKAEIIYYLDEHNRVRGFGVAFLVNANTYATDLESTLVDDFQNYFNERYGKFRVNDKNDEVWASKDGSYTIEMGDSSEDMNLLEIEIEIFKK